MSEPVPLPMSREEVVAAYFLEHRAKVIDLAAYLDRIERAVPSDSTPDFREVALGDALRILVDGQGDRARRILLALSDPSTDMPQSAHGMKGASGAPVPVSPSGGTS